MQVLVLVLALCAGVAHTQTPPDPECLKPGTKLLNGQTAQLCYGKEQASIVRLTCDWKTFGFNLEVIPDPRVKEIAFKQRPFMYSSASQGRALQPETPTNRQSCPVNSLPPYSHFVSFHDQPGEPIIDFLIDDGKVNYSTTVVVNEYHYTDETCTRQRFYITDVHLECCAIPRATPEVPFDVPVHRYCNLTECKVDPNFNCICRYGAGLDEDQWEVTAETVANLPSLGVNVGFQLSSLVAKPALGSQRWSLVENSVGASIPAHLEGSHLRGPTSHRVTINPFVFHPNHEETVFMTCKTTYCIRDPLQPIPPHLDYLPHCANGGASDEVDHGFFRSGPEGARSS